ncbi:MAG: RluA family pseudouridine synthase [Treponemataceae bacterium]|nr:RluA family pseudouridine synthase [Treponemataceae bacterium]
MDFTHVTAGQDDDGRRLDTIIRRYLPGQPLSRVYGALRKGLICVDSRRRRQDFRVRAGSDIAIARVLLDGAKNAPKTPAAPLPDDLVLFRNGDLLILNKPYDLPVQKARRDGQSLADMVWDDFMFRHGNDGSSLSFRCGPLHRLDRKTTGIVVFSQSLRGAQWFSQAIRAHAVQKKYLALVQNALNHAQTWEDTVAEKDTPSHRFHTVSVGGNGKHARTTVTPLAAGMFRGMPLTLVECTITTGRKHQIRAQAAAHGFPLLGDTAYGGIGIAGTQDFFLHAHRLVIGKNPIGVPPDIRAAIPDNFAKMLRTCLIKSDARL